MTNVTSPPQQLSRERILAAALRIADERGLAGLSMRALASDIGAPPMSLYRHVADKDAIFDGMVALMLEEIEPGGPHADWAVGIRAWALGFRRVARRHPGAFPLFASRPVTSYLAGREMAEAGLVTLRAAGFDAATAARALRTVVRYVIGFSLGESAGVGTAADADDRAASGLRAEGLPNLAHLVDDARAADVETLFEFGLDVIVDGLAIRRSGGACSVAP